MDALDEAVVVHIDVYAHHYLAFHCGIIRHKTLEVELVGTSRTDGLGNVDPANLGAVDEGVVSLGPVLVQGIVDGFDSHSQQRHKDEHHNVGNCEDAMIGQIEAEAVITDGGDNDAGKEGRYKGRADMHHISERREAENVGISVERPEENQVEKKAQPQDHKDFMPHHSHFCWRKPQHKGNDDRNNRYNYIQCQDHPRGQHLGSK